MAAAQPSFPGHLLVSAVAIAVLVLAIELPQLRALFAFDALAPWELGLSLASGLVALGWFEALEPCLRANA